MYYLEIIKITIILVILIIFVYFYILSLRNNIKYKVPQVSTFSSDFKILKKNLWKYDLKWKKWADLWSWIWKIIRFFEKNFESKMTWYEIDPSNVILAKFLNKFFSSKTKVIKWNYFEANLKQYDFIYVYLFPCLMEKLEEKIFSESKPWTYVFVNAFKFKNYKPIEIFYKKGKEKIFVYKV